MKRFYCYYENQTGFGSCPKIFRVAVGSDRRSQTKRVLLDNYAMDTGAFFRIWDDTTDYHLAQLPRHEADASASAGRGLKIVMTDIHTLYRNILDGTLDTIDNPKSVRQTIIFMLNALSPSFYLQNQRQSKKSSVPAVTRKNLSNRPSTEDSIAAVGFALMAILYWLASLVGCWEQALLRF